MGRTLDGTLARGIGEIAEALRKDGSGWVE